MKKKNLHYIKMYTIVMLFLFIAYNNRNFYETYNIHLNTLIIVYLCFHVGYVIANYREFVMTTSKLRKYYTDNNLRYKSSTLINRKINRIFVNDYVSDYWYELDYMLTIPRNCSVEEYNKFIEENKTIHQLYSTMINKRKSNRSSLFSTHPAIEERIQAIEKLK